MAPRRRWLPGILVVWFLGVAVPAGSAVAGESEVSGWKARFDAALSTSAQLAALGALAESSDDRPSTSTVEILEHVVSGRKLHPLLASQATQFLAQFQDQLGQREKAQGLRRTLGFQGDWSVLGPFAAEGRSGHARLFPPERDLATLDPDPNRHYPGKEHEVGWRRLPAEAFVEGAIFLDAVLRPDQDGVAYLVGYIHSETDQSVALRVGSPGPTKVWIGERLVLSRDVLRPALPDQDAAGVALPKGVVRIVVKTVVTQGPWRLYVRFTSPDGKPVPGVSIHSDKPAGRLGQASTMKTGGVVDLGRRLKTKAESLKTNAQAWLDYAQFAYLFSPEDREAKPVESALQKVLAFAEKRSETDLRRKALTLLGQVANEDADRRSALVERLSLVQDNKEKAEALYSLGRLWFRQDRDALAIDLWRKAEVLDAGNRHVQLALANEERRSGQAMVALARLATLPAAVQRLPMVVKARADLLLGMGRVEAAASDYRQIWLERRRDTSAVRDMVLIHRLRGEAAQAAALLRESADARPDLLTLVIEEAALLEGSGQMEKAIKRLREVSARIPDEAGLLEELGRTEARASQLSAALVSLRRSLALRPQNPVVRRYVDHLMESGQNASRRGEDLAKAHALDAESLAVTVFSSPSGSEDSPTEVLLDRTVVRVHPNGLSDRFVQRLVRINTERAAKDNQESWIRYEPGRQEVEVRVARVIRKKTGQGVAITQSTSRDERSLSEPWYGLYYDSRAILVGFENLKPGDLVEVQYMVSDIGYANELSDYFGDFQLISAAVPTRQWDYTLIVPRDRRMYFNPLDPNVVKREDTDKGETRIHRFSARDVPRVTPEPAMPGFAEIALYLHASTYKSWEEVGAWYWRLVADQLTDDGSLKRAAIAATAGQRTALGKVKALHRLVVENTRYVGLEFGIHGYKPYKSTQVLLRKFGDCKDKATLLLSLLRAVGVESELVLLRTRRGGNIDASPASLAVFDHAIAYVPQLDLYIDGTAEFSGINELPAGDQDVMALRVSPRGARLIRTPALPALANQADRHWRITLAEAGAATIEERFSITGQSAHEWREHYQSPGERRELYGKVWSGRFAGARLESVNMVLDDRNLAAMVNAKVSVPRLGEPGVEGRWRLPPSSREADFTRTYTRLSERKFPLLLGFPWLHREALRYELPAGYHVVSAPKSQVVNSVFGQFELRVAPSLDGRQIDIESTLRVEKDRIEPAEYPAFRAFLSDTDAILSDRLVVGKAVTP